MMHMLQIIFGTALSVCGAAAIAWVFFRALKRSSEPSVLILKWIITGVGIYFMFTQVRPMVWHGGFETIFALVSAALFGVVMAVLWVGSIVEIMAKPLGAMFDGGETPPEPKPQYSVALTKRKLRRPREAIVEVQKQLAQFPNDYEGVMLLATIQAEDTMDLASAETTLNLFCDSPDAPTRQVAAAFTQLADWHLKLVHDTDSARAALEKIIARFPESDLSAVAAQRIAHLGGVEKIMLAAQDRRPIAVPEGIRSAGLRDSIANLVPAETNPALLAQEYVKHLEQHPFDTDAREKLALLYAEHFHRLDLAADELHQLAAQPNLPAKRVAHWLNLLADLQVKHGADYDKVRPTLEAIIERFPDLPVAELARNRLDTLKLEIKGQLKTPTKQMGVYEQNIGLKYGPTYGSKD
jgi:TolA-binding protein